MTKFDQQNERNWREGVTLGFRLAAEAISKTQESNKAKIYDNLTEYIYGPLLTWFRSDCVKHEMPPDID